MGLLVGTSEGTAGIAGRHVTALAPETIGGVVWAILDGREIWRRDGEWAPVVSWDGPALTCLTPVASGLVVGTMAAHVLRLVDGSLILDETFDELPDRKMWYTPWGAPPDARSMASVDETVLVNIHVGGVARSDGASGSWQALVDIDVDVHQVAVAPDGSYLVATGAAGFGRSTDGGRSWRWDDEGLHGSYCRAVAVAGDRVLLSASTGPGRTRGAVYRRPLRGGVAWERVSDLVNGNIDTHWIAGARDGEAAYATADGDLWRSSDAGATWQKDGKVAGQARALVFVE